MTDEHLDVLWKRMQMATNIDNLEYGAAVTIGSIFGQLRTAIVNNRNEDLRIQSDAEYALSETLRQEQDYSIKMEKRVKELETALWEIAKLSTGQGLYKDKSNAVEFLDNIYRSATNALAKGAVPNVEVEKEV